MRTHPDGVNLGDDVAGFRLVRLLGSGDRSRVYLGHDGVRTAAVKVMGAAATAESVDDEIAALSSASHAHVVRLRDVGTAGGRPALVLEQLERTSLADLLASRRAVTGGEAVTILAPVVAAVGALHASGVAHGALAARRVLFRSSGAPVLTGFGHSSLFVTAGSAVPTVAVVRDDRRALCVLVRHVLQHTELMAAEPGVELADWIDSGMLHGFTDAFTDQLQERIFSLARPTPVQFDEASSRPVPVAMTPIVAQPPAPLPASRSWPARLRRMVPASLAAGPAFSKALSAARSVRKPFWVVAAVGGACLLGAAFVATPGSADQPAPAPTPVAAPAPTDSPVSGDEPAAALEQLLLARERCIRDLSVLCLENVAQSGSAAMDDDAALVRSIESGQTTGVLSAPVPGSFQLAERHGDAALVDYSVGENDQPASALLVKGEAGWRIRDYLSG